MQVILGKKNHKIVMLCKQVGEDSNARVSNHLIDYRGVFVTSVCVDLFV